MSSVITPRYAVPGAAANASTNEATRVAMCNIGPLANLAPVLQSLGCEPRRILISGGYDPDQLDNPDRRMPFLEASRLLAHCVEASGCQHLGLLLGERGNPSQLGLVGFLVRTAPTVERALQVLVDYLDLCDEAGYLKLETGPEIASLAYVIHLPDVEAVEQIYDMSVVMACNMMRSLCGESWRPRDVSLQRQPPVERLPYKRILGAPLHFNASQTAITFASHCLSLRAPTADELMHRYLEHKAVELHEMHETTLVDALPVLLSQALSQDRFSAPEIAAALGMHERTLHRRLKESGTSFRHELDNIRFALSQQMLRISRLTIEDIAISLRYASSSAFIRAFQRWTGTTPMRWRQQHVQH